MNTRRLEQCRHNRSWLLLAASLNLGGCMFGPSVDFDESETSEPAGARYIMHQAFREDGGQLESTGGGCVLAVYANDDPAAPAPELPPDGEYHYEQHTNGYGLYVTVWAQGAPLIEKHYDRAFIRERRVDDFDVTTPGGVLYHHEFWGGDSCETVD